MGEVKDELPKGNNITTSTDPIMLPKTNNFEQRLK